MLTEQVFGAKAKIKLPKLFEAFPSREFSLSDVAKTLSISAGTVYPALSELAETRVLLSRKVGGSTLYYRKR